MKRETYHVCEWYEDVDAEESCMKPGAMLVGPSAHCYCQEHGDTVAIFLAHANIANEVTILIETPERSS